MTGKATKFNVADLKRQISPRMFYGRMLKESPRPKKSGGWVDGGLCPFHPDKHIGSFRINLDTGGFKCFSCGASGGDIIDYVRRRQGCTFLEAIEVLKSEWGVRT